MSSTSKVLIDSQGGNSMLYLPLDKLMAATNVAPSPTNAASINSNNKQDEQDMQNARDLMRNREVNR